MSIKRLLKKIIFEKKGLLQARLILVISLFQQTYRRISLLPILAFTLSAFYAFSGNTNLKQEKHLFQRMLVQIKTELGTTLHQLNLASDEQIQARLFTEHKSMMACSGGIVGGMADGDDFDGDGVCNEDDLDDDNDGVLDTEECAGALDQFSVETSVTATSGTQNFIADNGEALQATITSSSALSRATYGGITSYYLGNGHISQDMTIAFDKPITEIKIYGVALSNIPIGREQFKLEIDGMTHLFDAAQFVVTLDDPSIIPAGDAIIGSTVLATAGDGRFNYTLIVPQGFTTIKLIHELLSGSPSGAGYDLRIMGSILADCDADNDNIPNQFDLDSDGDGCYDSYEAGVIGATSNGSASDSLAIVTTDTTGVGANGFVNTLETNENGVYTGNYTYAQAIDNNIATCPPPCTDPNKYADNCDFDGDGVNNEDDLDDDNDGVLDAIECPVSMTAPITGTYNFTESLGDFTFDYQLAADNSPTGLIFPVVQTHEGFTSAEIPANSPETGGSNINTPNVRITKNTGELFTSITLRFVAIDGNSNNESIKLIGTDTDLLGTNLSVSSITAPDGSPGLSYNSIAKTLNPPSGVVDVGGEVTITSTIPFSSIALSSIGPYNVISSIVSTSGNITPDRDNDGILNCFDLDSDNDGCYDSYEAGVPGATSNGSASDSLAIVTTDTTGVGANGFVNTLETNEDGVYTGNYTYAQAIDNNIATCPPPCTDPNKYADNCDFDGDGVNNEDDLDDDNDGVLDAIECPVSMTAPITGTYNFTESLGDFTFDYQLAADNSPTGLIFPVVQTHEGFTSAEIPANSPETGGSNINTPNVRITKNTGELFTSITLRFVAIDGNSNNESIKLIGTDTDLLGTNLSVSSITAPDGSPGLSYNSIAKTLNPPSGVVDVGGEVTITSTIPFSSIALSSIGPYNVISSIVSTSGNITPDRDNDGILNCFDLDSDNDGCYDSYEAGVPGATSNGSASDSLAIVTTDTTGVGANGFVNTLETNEDGVYTGNYTYAQATDMVSACVMPEIIAVQDTITITEGMMATISLLSNDTIRDSQIDTAGMQIYTQPTSGGTASLNPDGTLAYTPAMDFVGMDTIEYIVCDTSATPNTLCDTAMVIVTIEGIENVRFLCVNPVAETVTIKNFGNGTVDISNYRLCSKFTYTTNLTGETITSGALNLAPGDAVTLSLVNLTLDELEADLGLYRSSTFTDPNEMMDFTQWGSAGNGRESVAVAKGIWTAGDYRMDYPTYCYIGNGTTENGVNFWDGNDKPIALNDYEATIENTTLTIVNQVNDFDMDGDPLTTSIIGTSTAGVTPMVLNGDSISYTPPLNFNGVDTITYQICDNGTPILCDTAMVFVRIIGDNDNDGISDEVDLDDDNDGILDWDECESYEVTFTFNPSISDNTKLIYEATIDGIVETITLTASTNTQSLLGANSIPQPNAADLSIVGTTGIINMVDDTTHEAALNFATSLPISYIKFLDLDDMDKQNTDLPTDALGFTTAGYWTITTGDLAVYEVSSGALVTNNPSGNAELTLAATNGSAIEMLIKNALSGVLVRGTIGETNDGQATFTAAAPFTSTDLLVEDLSVNGGREFIRSVFNLEFITIGIPLCDPDMDGIPNYFDLDSDGDGCADALEAGHNQPMQADSTLAGPYGANGVADSVETNDTQTAVANYMLTETNSGTYDFLDNNLLLSCNEPPVITYAPDTTFVENGIDIVIDVITSDDNSGEIDSTLTYDLLGIDSAIFNIDSLTGEITFVTPPDFKNPTDNGMDNVYNISVVVCDEQMLCDTQAVAITILENQNPPLVIPNPLIIPQDSTGNICAPITDTNVGDTFSVNLCPGAPADGTANLTINGNELCVEYIPNAGFSGTDSVCVIVCDQTGRCDTATIPVTVVPPLPPSIIPAPPVIIPTMITVPEDSTAMVCTPILDQNVGDAFIASLCPGSPVNGTAVPTVNGNELCLEYTPNTGYVGDDPVCVIVCDQTGLCDTVIIPVTVIPTPLPPDSIQPPVVVFPPIVGPQDSTHIICGPIVDNTPFDTHTVTFCQQPTNGTATAVVNNTDHQLCVTFTPNTGFAGTDSLCLIVCDQSGLCDTVIVPILILPTYTALKLKVMLQGAMIGTSDGLMRDDLRSQNHIPLNQPYDDNFNNTGRFTHVGGGSEVTNNTVLSANIGTPDAIVDWVFVELRDPLDATSVIKTISALVQRDGDVVNAASGEVLLLQNLPASFFVSVKHRNHLGAMTKNQVVTTNDTATVDFTIMELTDFYSTTGYETLAVTTLSGKRALWGGNANKDNKTKYDGSANDRIIIANDVLTDVSNTIPILNYANTLGYYQGDVNMDGRAKYDGSFNDRILIQNIVLTYPLNFNDLQVNNYNNMLEQLP